MPAGFLPIFSVGKKCNNARERPFRSFRGMFRSTTKQFGREHEGATHRLPALRSTSLRFAKRSIR
ncbi:hypothetical protein BCEN4_1290023 [Burkholderia cenocepacia]|nr:hypothetical protein BCEN4_1290023 [Burkholderia cenocepacia]